MWPTVKQFQDHYSIKGSISKSKQFHIEEYAMLSAKRMILSYNKQVDYETVDLEDLASWVRSDISEYIRFAREASTPAIARAHMAFAEAYLTAFGF